MTPATAAALRCPVCQGPLLQVGRTLRCPKAHSFDLASLSEVQRAVRHMAIIHIKQANKEKELKANGTISSECHAD